MHSTHTCTKISNRHELSTFVTKYFYIFQDNPELFSMMEKTRMYIFRNLDPEVCIALYNWMINIYEQQQNLNCGSTLKY